VKSVVSQSLFESIFSKIFFPPKAFEELNRWLLCAGCNSSSLLSAFGFDCF
jgi:hypothetical protein